MEVVEMWRMWENWQYLSHMTSIFDFIKCWMKLTHRSIQWEDEHKQFPSFFYPFLLFSFVQKSNHPCWSCTKKNCNIEIDSEFLKTCWVVMINSWRLSSTFQISKFCSPFEKDVGSSMDQNHLVDGCHENTSTTLKKTLNIIVDLQNVEANERHVFSSWLHLVQYW